MRPCHILKSNKATQMPQRVIFFDTESRLRDKGRVIYHDVYLIVGKYVHYRSDLSQGKTSELFHTSSPEEFWSWVESKVHAKEKLYLIAHNVGYDLITSQGLMILPQKGWKVKTLYEKGRTFHLVMQNGKRSLSFINLANYFTGTLREIGEEIGLEKLELDYTNPDYDKALTYCQRDVEIVERAFTAFLEFIQEHNLGNFAVTAPAQAFNAFRHRFNNHKIYIHNHPKAIELERSGYYGGRTEAFKVGEIKDTPVYDLDVNSMYPSVMIESRFPVRLIFYEDRVLSDNLRRLLGKYLLMARVILNTRVNVFPLSHMGTLIFPVGRFETVLSTPELELALDLGVIEQVLEVAAYEPGRIFTDYVSFFYEKRKTAKLQGKREQALLFKLMLNSLYGKFGQKQTVWKPIAECPPDEIGVEEIYSSAQNRWITIKKLGGTVLEAQGETEGYNSFPAIAAHVTAYARRKLWEYMKLAGIKNVLYLDTDSIFVNREGYENLKGFIAPDVLGLLKPERVFSKLTLYNLKDYEGDGIVKMKGVPRSAKRISEEQFQFDLFPHFGTLVRKGAVSKYYNIKTIKSLKRMYQKGWVLKDGTVVPLEFGHYGGKNHLFTFTGSDYERQGLELKDYAQEEFLLSRFG